MVVCHDIRNSSLSGIDQIAGSINDLLTKVGKTYLDLLNIRSEEGKSREGVNSAYPRRPE